MDLQKIKEAAAREAEREAGIVGPAREAYGGWDSRKDGTGAWEDRATLLAAVPDLLREIERLARLAHVGWERARSEAEDAGNEEGETFAAETLGAHETLYGTIIAEPKS